MSQPIPMSVLPEDQMINIRSDSQIQFSNRTSNALSSVEFRGSSLGVGLEMVKMVEETNLNMHEIGADANFEGFNPSLEPSDLKNMSVAESVLTAGQRFCPMWNSVLVIYSHVNIRKCIKKSVAYVITPSLQLKLIH
jgi:hypothetical protein